MSPTISTSFEINARNEAQVMDAMARANVMKVYAEGLELTNDFAITRVEEAEALELFYA